MTNNYNTTDQVSCGCLLPTYGNVWVENYTGLTVGGKINQIGMGVKINGTGYQQATNNYDAGTGAFGTGFVFAEKFSELKPGVPISQILLKINIAAGNVRVKIYQDNGSGTGPNILLAESGTLVVPGAGVQGFAVGPVTVPSNGILWAAFENDNGALDIHSNSINHGVQFEAHTYGAGPNPFVSGGTTTTFSPWMALKYYDTSHIRIKIYQDNGVSNTPSTLLGETDSVQVTGIGKVNFTISPAVTVPATGRVWVGFEQDSQNLDLYVKNTAPVTVLYTPTPPHTYGTGPSPFGTATKVSAQGFWNQLTYQTSPKVITMKFDGSTLSTTPSTPNTNTTGGFSGITFNVPSATFGGHIVNASDTGGSFATSTFTIPYATSNFTISGYVFGQNGVFPNGTIFVFSNSNLNMTNLQLYNTTHLLSSHNFSPPFAITANTTMTIPWNFTDNIARTGTQTYTEQATLQQGSNTQVISSNAVSLNYGSFPIGDLTLNYTNPLSVPIWFHQSNVNSTSSRVDVIYPNTATMSCNMAYEFAQVNHTYTGLPFVVYDASQDNSSFLFVNKTNDIVKINCTDTSTGNFGLYQLTQSITSFPFVEQIKSFRAGTYGTTGQFGMLDIITLSVIIFSMIGFNRINEAVGAFFAVAITGGAAYFGILTFPGIMAAAVAIVVLLAVITTRKTGGF